MSYPTVGEEIEQQKSRIRQIVQNLPEACSLRGEDEFYAMRKLRQETMRLKTEVEILLHLIQ